MAFFSSSVNAEDEPSRTIAECVDRHSSQRTSDDRALKTDAPITKEIARSFARAMARTSRESRESRETRRRPTARASALDAAAKRASQSLALSERDSAGESGRQKTKVFDDDGRDATPRALRADASGGGRREDRTSAFATVASARERASERDWSETLSVDFGAESISRRARVASSRATRDGERADVVVVVERDGQYVSDTALLDADANVDSHAIDERNAAYLQRLEAKASERSRARDAGTQTTTVERFHARALTESRSTVARATLASECDDGNSRSSASDASARVGSPALTIRTKAVRTTEFALGERERAEYCLTYRALRPAAGESALIRLDTLDGGARTRGLSASCVKFNPSRSDLFCVAYGEFNFEAAHRGDRAGGALAFWSLRSRQPLRVEVFDRGVMTIDWCATKPSAIGVGCYDGEVVVVDVGEFGDEDESSRSRSATTNERLASNGQRHNDPVWGVKWVEIERDETIDDEEDAKSASALVSASTDGKVRRWDVRGAMRGVDVFAAKWSPPGADIGGTSSSDEQSRNGTSDGFHSHGDDLVRHGGVMCLDFSSDGKYYVVGTREGKIHKCSLAYVDECLSTYASHIGPVYAVKWNPHHSRVFASCSADWTVRVFVDDASDADADSFMSTNDSSSSRMKSAPIQPRFIIEHSQHPINAIDWSPWCSTEFAVATDDGTLEIWDLASSAVVPKHVAQVTDDHKAAVTVAYAHDAPIILVGCASGAVCVYRLTWHHPTDGVASREARRRALDAVVATDISSRLA